ncbi:MAG: DegT/DnrJ/EryC1/StrS family aminotransferase [Firmicutes bacterium]|jgi:UDP-2-acetamido-2-deoxy-ribo-hexuluronate aminotransferase|nr:DegT/DnrJ/EryC1/StrS family aminotransferase [Bacillota bacterium]
MQFIDLHRQYNEIADGINKRFSEVLKHKAFIGGPEVKELEAMLRKYTGMEYVITCASGTDALTIPLMAYEITKSDAIFVPSFSFFASAESIALAGGTPVFVDVDEHTFNMDVADLEEKIRMTAAEGNLTPRGIVAVDLFGQPADFTQIKEIAQKYDLFVLEDGAQGFGGEINDKKACSFGDVGATSFFPAKPLGCYGDGGAIFTNDKALFEKMKSIHVHGQGTDKYENVRLGLNSRLDSLQAAVLIEKLKIFENELNERNRVAERYNELLQDFVETPVVKERYRSSWAQYTVKASSKEMRDSIIQKMKDYDIPVMIYYPIPIHRSGAFRYLKPANLSKTEHLSDVVFSLPMHPYLKNDEIEDICDQLKSILE